MAKKASKRRKSTKAEPKFTPEAIVAAWSKRIKARLKPWFLDKEVFDDLEPKLEKNIEALLATGSKFEQKDMTNSLRVAGDAARICKILQPTGHPKKIPLGTFQQVLKLCATKHRVCATPAGGGGWCDIG